MQAGNSVPGGAGGYLHIVAMVAGSGHDPDVTFRKAPAAMYFQTIIDRSRGSDAQRAARRGLLTSTAIFAVLTATAPELRAESFTWTGAANGLWGAAANWIPATGIPDDASDTAVLPGAAAGAIDINGALAIAESRAFGAIEIEAGAGRYDITSSDDADRLVASGAAPRLRFTGRGAGDVTEAEVSAPLLAAAGSALEVKVGSDLTLTLGRYTGSGDLTKTGSGLLNLTGASNATQAVSVAEGTLSVASNLTPTALSVADGAHLVNAAGGSVVMSAAPIEVAGSLVVQGTIAGDAVLTGGTATVAGAPAIVAGRMTLDAESVLSVAGGGLVSAVDSAGTVTNAGTVQNLAVSGGSATNTGLVNGVTVTGGTLANRTGTIGGALVVADGGTATSGGIFADADVAAGGVLEVTGGSGGGVTSAGTLDNAGTLQSVESAGTALNSGTITTSLDLTGGTMSNLAGGVVSGAAAVGTGAELDSAGTLGAVDIAAGGMLRVTGGTTGALTSGGRVEVTGGVAGDIEQSGGAGMSVSAGGRAGAVTVSGAGANSNAGRIASLDVAAGSFVNSGRIEGALDLTGAGSDVTNAPGGKVDGATSVAGGTLRNAGTLGATGIGAAGALEMTGGSAGAVTNDGTLSLAGGTLAGLDNLGGARLSGGLAAGVTNRVGAMLTVETGGAAGATLVEGGTVTNAGTLSGPTQTAGSVANDAGGTIAGNAILSGGTFTANGGSIGGATVLSGAARLEVAADSALGGTLTNDATIAAQAGGPVGLTLSGAAGGTFTNRGTIDGQVAALSITAGDIVLAEGSQIIGEVALLGDLSVGSTTGFSQDLAGDLTVLSGGVVEINDDIDAMGFDLSVRSGGALSIATGTAGDTTDVTGVGSITNDAGGPGLELGAFTTVTASGAFVNDGETEIGAGATLTAGTIRNLSGTIVLRENAALVGSGNTTTNGAVVTLADGAAVRDAGAIVNLAGGRYTYSGSGELHADTDNDGDAVENAGLIETLDGGGDTLTVGDGAGDFFRNLTGGILRVGAGDSVVGTGVTLTNAGSADGAATVVVGSGALLDVAAFENRAFGSLEVEGTVRVADGPLENAEGGAVSVSGGGTLSGGVANAGTLYNYGTVSGTLVNSGTAMSAGTLGELDNRDGRAVLSGVVSGDVAVDGGTVTVEAGGTIAGDATVGADGQLAVTGGVIAGSTTSAGRLTLGAEALAGAVTTSGAGSSAGVVSTLAVTDGSFVNSGIVGGAVTVSGGLLQNTGGTVGGTASVTGGTLESTGTLAGVSVAAGGSFDLVSGTAFDVMNAGTSRSAGTIASLTNTGDAAIFRNSGAITGDVSVTGGTVSSTGIVGGASTVSGGTLHSSGSLQGVSVADRGTLRITGGSAGAIGSAGAVTVSAGQTQSIDITDAGTLNVGADGIVGAVTSSSSASAGANAIFGTADSLTVESGFFEVDGTILGALVQNGGGTVTVGGEVNGLTEVNDGRLVSRGTLAGVEVDAGARLRIAGGSAGDISSSGALSISGGIVGDVDNDGGTLTVAAGARLGEVTSAAPADLAGNFLNGTADSLTVIGGDFGVGGTVLGVLTQRGAERIAVTASGSVGGATRVERGSLVSAGTLAGVTVLDGADLAITDGSAGDLSVAGTALIADGRAGSVDVAATGRLTVEGGATGAIDNAGTLTVASGIAASLSNAGTAVVSGGSIGRMDSTGLLTITGGAHGALGVTGAGATATVDNARVGDIAVADGARVALLSAGATGGAVRNEGATFSSAGTIASLSTIGGTSTNSGTILGTAAVLAGELRQSGTIGGITVVGQAGAVTGETGTFAGIESAGEVTLSGGSAGAVETSGTLTATDAVLGHLANSGTATLRGGSASALVNSGDLTSSARTGQILSTGGRVDIVGGGVVTGPVTVTGGTFLQNADGALGNVDASGEAVVRNLSDAGVAGDVSLADAARFENRSAGGVRGAVTLSGGTFLNESESGVAGDVSQSGGTFDNVSGAVAGSVTLSAGAFDNASDEGILGSVTLAGGTFTNGSAFGVGGGVVQTGGTFDNLVGRVNGGLILSEGTFTNAAAVRGGIAQSGGTIANDGTVTGAVSLDGGTFGNRGRIEAVTLSSGAIANAGIVTGAVTQSGGRLDNTGEISGEVTMSGGTFGNASGAGIDGTLDQSGGVFTHAEGAITGSVRLSGDARFNAAGGSLGGALRIVDSAEVVATGTTNVAGDVVNAGTISAGADAAAITLTGGLSQVFSNAGLLDGSDGALSITAADIVLTGTSVVQGDVTLLGTISVGGPLTLTNDFGGDLNVAPGADVTIGADIDANGFDISIAAGATLRIPDGTPAEGTRLGNIGALTNSSSAEGLDIGNYGDVAVSGAFVNDGITRIGDGATLVADTISNLSGTIFLGRDATVVGTGNTTRNDAAIALADGGSLTDAGGIDNTAAGRITFGAGGTLAADTDNDGDVLLNAGVIETTDGGADLVALGDGAAPDLVRNVSGTLSVGETDTVAGPAIMLTNGGTADDEGLVEVGAGGTLRVAEFENGAFGTVVNAGTIDVRSATLVNRTDGTVTSTGTIASGLDNEGALDNAGTITGTVANTGTGRNTGTLAALTQSAGRFETTGIVTGTLDVAGGTVTNGGRVSGATTVGEDGTLVSSGTLAEVTNIGRLTIAVDGTAGAVINSGTGASAGTLAALGNSGSFANTGTIRGGVGNAGGGRLTSTGTIGGNLSNVGSAEAGVAEAVLSGVVDGTVETGGAALLTFTDMTTGLDALTQAAGGTLRVAGDVTLDAGAPVLNAGDATVEAGATLAAEDAALANRAGGVLRIAPDGTLGMDLLNEGTARIDGSVEGRVENRSAATLGGLVSGDFANLDLLSLTGEVGGDLVNAEGAVLTVRPGPGASVGGTLANAGQIVTEGRLDFVAAENDGTVVVRTGSTLGGGTLLNRGELRLQDGATATGEIRNVGRAILRDGARAGDLLRNSGTVLSFGEVSTGGLTSTSGSVLRLGATPGSALDIGAPFTADVLRIDGNAELNGTIVYDVDLSGPSDANAVADRIEVRGASLAGEVVLEFAPVSPDVSLFGEPVALIDYAGVADYSLSFETRGLPTSTAVLYSVRNDPDSQAVELEAGANPAVGGLASGIALTQSLIGSVINRPSSPFVAGLAGDAADPCGHGSWARATGGRAEAEGTSSTELGAFDSEIEASYGGLQVGGDFSCFDGRFNGWNLTFGGLLGVNQGRTEQPVFAFDPLTGRLDTGRVTSVNETDFTQTYGGVYLAATREGLAGDLQYRHELTRFSLENDPTAPGTGLGVDDQDYESRANTLSGSVSYAVPMKGVGGLSLVPTAGFSISRVSTDSLAFSNLEDADVLGDLGTDDAVLEFEDFTTKVGFLGATVSHTRVLPDGQSALNLFATGTYYRDFSDGVEANYFRVDKDGDKVGDPLSSTSGSLGDYGEVSLGLNYTRLLSDGSALPASQFNGSVRLDTRFSESLDSWGVTAQMRLQF
ncbi:hypothetical protein SAMN04515678_10866 [Roseivivax sediminis]|uniref:Autotransporter domain-containing protein n=2 Tax=Roseivivax sediminis TaxID=936889 RepID=A0A1I1ZBG6_9RHOB|nr:hypothetical protein SAMN04515678_10866 [Roseivivax sediminis]